MERIRLRGRDYEQQIEPAYLEQLNGLYEEWIEGFGLCPVLTVEADHLDFVQNGNHLELIAQRVIQESEKVLHIRLQQAKLNLAILTQWIDQHQGLVEWVPPQGGVSAFLRLSRISDTEAFCRRLADMYGVFLLPGTCFAYPQHVRLGFGGPTGDLQEGLSRLSSLLHEVT